MMHLVGFAAVATSLAAGWLGLSCLVRLPSDAAGRAVHVLLAVLFGMAVTGVTAYTLLVLTDSLAFVPAVDAATLIGLAGLFRITRPGVPLPPVSPDTGQSPRWMVIALAVLATIALIGIILAAAARPHGGWDAWTGWSLRAVIMGLSGDEWRLMLEPAYHSPDYPPLMSLAGARMMAYAGAELVWAMPLESILAAVVAVGLPAAGAWHIRGEFAGVVTGLMMLSVAYLLYYAHRQYADTLLGAMLAGVVFLLVRGENHRGAILAAGALAGAMCFTKTEGALLVACLAAAYGVHVLVREGVPTALARAGLVIAGAAPWLVSLLHFRGQVQANHLFTETAEGSFIARLSDMTRLWDAFVLVASRIIYFSGGVIAGIIIIACLMGFRRPAQKAAPSLAAGFSLMLVAYTLVFAGFPLDLDTGPVNYHNRMLLHLVPGSVFILVLFLRLTPEPQKTESKP